MRSACRRLLLIPNKLDQVVVGPSQPPGEEALDRCIQWTLVR